MDNNAGPVDRNTTLSGDYHVSLSDLEPIRGITDELDDVLFGLCDRTHAETPLELTCRGDGGGTNSGTDSKAAFCQHLRLATNADTVYLCEQQSLCISATTSHDCAEDTEEMHRALTAAISDLEDCGEAFRLSDVRVFPEQARLSFSVVPLTNPSEAKGRLPQDTQRKCLAIIVDADEEYREVNACIAPAIQAIFTSFIAETQSPTSRQLQVAVFDQLKQMYGFCSEQVTARRHEIFLQDLQHVSVHFEKLISLNDIETEPTTGTNVLYLQQPGLEPKTHATIWGWQAVASLIANDQYPHALHQQAELWGEVFSTDLDIHILKQAAMRYKDVCEAANLHTFANIKPLSVRVYSQSLLQHSYLDTLQQLIEMAVIRGDQLLLELSEKTSVSVNTTETAAELQLYKQQLESCSKRFGVTLSLGEFGTGHSSLLRATTLCPNAIKLSDSLLPDHHLSFDSWVDAALRLSQVVAASVNDSNPEISSPAPATAPAPAPVQILVDGSQLPVSDQQQDRLHDIDRSTVGRNTQKFLVV